MRCYVYRSSRKVDTYLYVVKENDFSDVPESLMQVFGAPEFALEFDLTPDRPLAQEDPAQVFANLERQGFHLQLPPATEVAS